MNSSLALRIAGLLLVFILSGCKTATELDAAYELAQSCVALQTYEDGTYVVSNDSGYTLASVEESEAEKFYIKPAALGSFLLYDREGQFLGLDVLRVGRFDSASKKTEWQINEVTVAKGGEKIADSFTLRTKLHDLRLSHRDNHFFLPKADISLVTTQRSAFNFIFQDPEACKQFPEDDLDAIVSEDFYVERDPTAKVKGWVDYHAHLGFPKTMAGVVMAGEAFHPYGIEHALEDCDGIHGKNGALDLLGQQHAGIAAHSTRGYPHFDDWPKRGTITHVQTYHKWIERAYLSGLRIMVTHATGNPAFCQLMSTIHFDDKEGDCSASDTVRLQTEYIYKIQDYIDAQAGGPGKGWFRVATSSRQAREIINDNKMAVVLGSEYGTLFNCRSSNEGCDAGFIDRELQKIYDMGIRHVFPIHRFDNAFGGTQPGGISWMHLASKIDTGKTNHVLDFANPWGLLFKSPGGNFFDMEECPAGVKGDSEVPSMREFLENEFLVFTDLLRSVPVVGQILNFGLDLIFIDKLEPIPEYTELQDVENSCNRRTLQPAGEYLVNRVIDKGMILEVDHMSYNTTMEAMKILEARNYSGVVSSHNFLRDKETNIDRVFKLGGMAVTFNGSPSGIAEIMQSKKAQMEKYDFEIGVGVGTDIQGLVAQTMGDDGYVPVYP
ncbi:MAG: hypothetical protein MI867_16410, partial [Pseudomonadales bacterium]|nr:hypothetical protein [Pseudomonadales bacterium]